MCACEERSCSGPCARSHSRGVLAPLALQRSETPFVGLSCLPLPNRYTHVTPAPGIIRSTIILDAFDKMKVQPAMRLARAQNIEGLGKLWRDSNQMLEEWKAGPGGPAPLDLLTTDPTAMRVLMCMFSFIARLFNPRAARRYGLHSEDDSRLHDLLAICDYLDDTRKRYLAVSGW